jgi:MscS family membrane protein
MRLPRQVRFRLLAPGLLVLATLAHAAPGEQLVAPAPTPVPQDENAGDPYGRDTPHGSFFGFLKAAEKGSYGTAAEYLQIPTSLRPQREQIAAQFQEVLDQRFVSTSLERSISRSPRGTLEDGLPPNVDRVGDILGPEGSFEVVLVRREAPGAAPVWLISWDTIREARQIYGELGAPAVARKLPSFSPRRASGRCGCGRSSPSSCCCRSCSGLVAGGRGASSRSCSAAPQTRRALPVGSGLAARSPATLLLALLVHRVAVFWLDTGDVPHLLQPVPSSCCSRSSCGCCCGSSTSWTATCCAAVMPIGRKAGVSSLRSSRRLRGVAILLVPLLALPVFGVNDGDAGGPWARRPGARFAAQKSLENVQPGFAILGPALSVGDTCRIGGQLGDVGTSRSGPRACAPTSAPWSASERRCHDGQIENLRGATSSGSIRRSASLRDDARADGRSSRSCAACWRADPRVGKEARVRFARLGASSLDVDVHAYVHADSYSGFLAVQEELLLRVLEIVEAAGASVAFPTQTVHLHSGGPPDVPPSRKDGKPE